MIVKVSRGDGASTSVPRVSAYLGRYLGIWIHTYLTVGSGNRYGRPVPRSSKAGGATGHAAMVGKEGSISLVAVRRRHTRVRRAGRAVPVRGCLSLGAGIRHDWSQWSHGGAHGVIIRTYY